MLDENGHEVLDRTPVAVPVRFQRPQNLVDRMKDFIRGEMSRQMEAQGSETFEEADDFDTGEDDDVRTVYELDGMQEITDPAEFSKLVSRLPEKVKSELNGFVEQRPTEQPAQNRPDKVVDDAATVQSESAPVSDKAL